MSTGLTAVVVVVLALALHPALQGLVNLFLYRRPPGGRLRERPRVSILIPARDEEAVIRRAVVAALADREAVLEVVVMDDQSTDRTAAIVDELARLEPRVRLETAPPLAPGWCGKQHACQALADAARGEILLFVDADVELAPDAPSRIAAFLDASGAGLASGVPRQVTGTLAESLLIPLIHFVLLGYLPISAMRRSLDPALAAGCGQLFAARRDAYDRAGGAHCDRMLIVDCGRAIAGGSMEELAGGLALPRHLLCLTLDRRVAANALGPGLEVEGDTLRAALGDVPRELEAILGRIRAAGLGVADIRLESPGLEEIFTRLTGRELRE